MNSPSRNDAKFLNFDHLKFWVGNAKQAADWYCIHFGFRNYAYKGLENGSKSTVSHVVRLNQICIIFESPLDNNLQEENSFLIKHGDAVKDVAFEVKNIDLIVEKAKEGGARIVRDTYNLEDVNGVVRMAVLQVYGDVTHTLIDRSNYKGLFLPGYTRSQRANSLLETLEMPNLTFIDHVVGGQPLDQMEKIVRWYENVFGFRRFLSIDDQILRTEFSSMRLSVVADETEKLKIPVCEPVLAENGFRSQIQEFLDYNHGPGIQHVAFHTDDIVGDIRILKNRGVEFVSIPETYYDVVRKKLKFAKIRVQESLEKLREFGIMIDYDDEGYLLQIFTKPVQDRPTFFLEIIQRRNFRGFGAGNIKSLFQAIELQQKMRGNL